MQAKGASMRRGPACSSEWSSGTGSITSQVIPRTPCRESGRDGKGPGSLPVQTLTLSPTVVWDEVRVACATSTSTGEGRGNGDYGSSE